MSEAEVRQRVLSLESADECMKRHGMRLMDNMSKRVFSLECELKLLYVGLFFWFLAWVVLK